MPTELSLKAVEEGTYIITSSFFDEEGTPVIPKAGLSWRLTDEFGNVINNRGSVALTPATSVTVVLSGDDLATDATSETRVFTVSGTYDSSLGQDLPIKDQAIFDIASLAAYPL